MQNPISSRQTLTTAAPQAMRSAYGDAAEGGSSGVRLTLDTNVVMLKENPYSPMVSDRHVFRFDTCSTRPIQRCMPAGTGCNWRLQHRFHKTQQGRQASKNLDAQPQQIRARSPAVQPSCYLSDCCRWARDLSQQVSRTEVTRFPHAVLDIQLDQAALHSPSQWLQVRPDSRLRCGCPGNRSWGPGGQLASCCRGSAPSKEKVL